MEEEIKEIVDSIKYAVDEDDWFEIEGHFLKPLLDYITNLQEENERLNNIINELEKYLIKEKKFDEYKDVIYRETISYVLDKLNELRNK